MNSHGLIWGIFMFLLIGFGHILVIKGEYHFGTGLWPTFLILGLSSLIGSVSVRSHLLSGFLGIAGFTFPWSIHEVFKQKEHVGKGWFPENPKRQI